MSPCDIHTCVVCGSPAMSGSDASPTVSIARPYSRLGAAFTLAAVGRSQILRAVADAQQRQPALDARVRSGTGAWASRTEQGLPERITPRTDASGSGHRL